MSVLYRFVSFSLFFTLFLVVNFEVFVQQTMKTASSDEELAFKQKERVPSAEHALSCLNCFAMPSFDDL